MRFLIKFSMLINNNLNIMEKQQSNPGKAQPKQDPKKQDTKKADPKKSGSKH